MNVLLNEDQIQQGVSRLAVEISSHYASRPLTIIAIMTGSVVLLADLIRQLEMPLRVGVLQASSYRGGVDRSTLTINADLMPDIEKREVLLIDDIFDTGHTLDKVIGHMNEFGPKSLHSAVLLRKQGRCEVAIEPDFTAFEIPDQFVVGYGLDYQDAYRNLPFIAALGPEDFDGEMP